MRRISRIHALLERRWRLAQFLQSARTGRTVASVVDHLSISRATLYRDLEFLRDTGAPLSIEVVNGETRYKLLGQVPAVVGSPLRAVALDLAIASLEPLRGTKLVAELGQLRRGLSAGNAPPIAVRSASRVASPEVVATLERACAESRELTLHYRGANDCGALERTVRPIELQLIKGQLYLPAFDTARQEVRTFKVARITTAQVGALFDRSETPHVPKAPSVLVWQAAAVSIVVRLAPSVARFAAEYPLISEQRVHLQQDGAAVVHAQVAGEEEALRWVLSWGRNATVVSPLTLRNKVHDELRAAVATYGPGPKRAGLARGRPSKVSHGS